MVVRVGAVLLGAGAGSLLATIVGLVAWPVLELASVTAAPEAALLFGVLVGLGGGGFVAGRAARLAHVFHGALSGLALAGLVTTVARLGGSPAATGQVLVLAVVAIVVGGLGGAISTRF